jgi:uncharacterized protein (TIGR00255 family)
MINSMTGFARSEAATPGGVLLWEIRSINHRYLEVQLRLPEALRGLENDARQLALASLGRGRVEATLSLRGTGPRVAPTNLNLPLARQLIAQSRELAREIPDVAPLNALELLRWPGVLETEEQDPGELASVALATFGTALGELAAARAREGARIREMLTARVTEIEALVAAVRKRLPEVLERIRERLRERVAALGAVPAPERLELELVLIAQKTDVAEELDRLLAHLAEFSETLDDDKPVGRRLDFLVQELNREANTLSSKSADAETTRQAVDIKVLVEQLREQVQNVE